MITAKMVQELREKTGAGMMDCKKALEAADGDMTLAIENLRKSGAAKAEKKSGRSTNQGKVWTIISGKDAAIIEVLCETDFAANTEKFAQLVDLMAKGALKVAKTGDIAAELNEQEKSTLHDYIGTISENIQLRRAQKWQSAGNTVFAGYHHMGGRVSVLIEVEGESDPAFLNDICMHIAAFNPTYASSADVPAEVIAKEKEIALAADPKLQGKPAQMLDKILMGKIGRFFSDVCLMNQPWVKDDKTCLAKIKPNLKVKRFLRWAVGEEI